MPITTPEQRETLEKAGWKEESLEGTLAYGVVERWVIAHEIGRCATIIDLRRDGFPSSGNGCLTDIARAAAILGIGKE